MENSPTIISKNFVPGLWSWFRTFLALALRGSVLENLVLGLGLEPKKPESVLVTSEWSGTEAGTGIEVQVSLGAFRSEDKNWISELATQVQ